MPVHFTKFDFLTLWVREETRQANIDWYVNHLGLAVGWDSPGEKLTLLQFPSGQAITLLAHYSDNTLLPEGDVRVCLTTGHLHGTKAYLAQQGISMTEIYKTPWNTEAFDFSDPQGTRLTATSPPDHPKAETSEDNRFHSYFINITVSNLSEIAQWYSGYLGMSAESCDGTSVYQRMKMPGDEHYLVYLSEAEKSHQRIRPNKHQITAIRPFFQMKGKPELAQSHSYFKSKEIYVTDITGNSDDFMRWFDFADPDGNPLYAIAY